MIAGRLQGRPDISARRLFANLRRRQRADGGLSGRPRRRPLLRRYDRGEIRKIHYCAGQRSRPPELHRDADVRPGAARTWTSTPALDDPDGDPLTYAWDLDGDGQYDDATGVTTSRTYSGGGDVEVGLQVSDGAQARTTSRTVGRECPAESVNIDSPSSSRPALEASATRSRSAGTASDPEDGDLPAGARLDAIMGHCPSNCHSHIIETFSGVAERLVRGAGPRLSFRPESRSDRLRLRRRGGKHGAFRSRRPILSSRKTAVLSCSSPISRSRTDATRRASTRSRTSGPVSQLVGTASRAAGTREASSS